MYANVGDRLLVKAHRYGETDREALIIEVIAGNGRPPYRVRWADDHHEGLIYPEAIDRIEHFTCGELV